VLPAVTLTGVDSAAGGAEIHTASIVSGEAMADSSNRRWASRYGEHALIGDDPSKTTLQKHTTNHKYLRNKYSHIPGLRIEVNAVTFWTVASSVNMSQRGGTDGRTMFTAGL
jgi:hypothetical protein